MHVKNYENPGPNEQTSDFFTFVGTACGFITRAINTSNELQQNKELNKLGIITCLSEEVFHHIRWKLNWNYSTIDLVEIQYSVTIDDMSDFNYQPNLSEFKRILNQWIQRKLSSINEFKENSPQLT